MPKGSSQFDHPSSACHQYGNQPISLYIKRKSGRGLLGGRRQVRGTLGLPAGERNPYFLTATWGKGEKYEGLMFGEAVHIDTDHVNTQASGSGAPWSCRSCQSCRYTWFMLPIAALPGCPTDVCLSAPHSSWRAPGGQRPSFSSLPPSLPSRSTNTVQ